MNISLSLRVLGSKELRNQITKDIDDLLSLAKRKKMKPVILTVGNIFMETGVAHTLIHELGIADWSSELCQNTEILSELFRQKKLSLMLDCEKGKGLFGHDREKKVKIFFDPDEPYLCLVCADPKSKAKAGHIATSDGYAYFKMKYLAEETLVQFIVEKFN